MDIKTSEFCVNTKHIVRDDSDDDEDTQQRELKRENKTTLNLKRIIKRIIIIIFIVRSRRSKTNDQLITHLVVNLIDQIVDIFRRH